MAAALTATSSRSTIAARQVQPGIADRVAVDGQAGERRSVEVHGRVAAVELHAEASSRGSVPSVTAQLARRVLNGKTTGPFGDRTVSRSSVRSTVGRAFSVPWTSMLQLAPGAGRDLTDAQLATRRTVPVPPRTSRSLERPGVRPASAPPQPSSRG